MRVKEASKYLVYAKGVRWDGADGIKFCDSYRECFYRSYDVDMEPIKASKGKKWLQMIEYSHDVPMGNMTAIIALTDREYKHLNNCDVSDVIEWAKKLLKI